VDAELTFRSTVLVAVFVAAVPTYARYDVQQPPDAGFVATMAPTIVKRQLSNGLRVWIVEQHDFPVVQMSLVVLTGTDADPRGRYGIASLTASMLTEGAGSRSAVEIGDTLDKLVANLSGASSVDSTSLQLYVPAVGLAEALQLMADVSQRPTFPTESLDRMRRQRVGALRNARGDPDATAALAFARSVFGPSHRSGAALIGTVDSLNALTTEALRTFHDSVYRPDNSTMIVVGDVTPDEIVSLLETRFGKWRPAAAPGVVQERAAAVQKAPRQVTLVDMPDAPQSRIVMGGVGARGMADFFPIQVLNAVLQGRLSPDRNPTLRDYTTGVRSGADMRKGATPFVIAAAAQTDRTAASLKALVDELTGIVKNIPADELARAKDELARTFPRTFERTGRISSRLEALESIITYGLPDDYYANYASAIRAVDAAAVRRVAQEYIDPDRLAIVVVGDRKAIEPSIRALNLGSIKAVSIDEVFAPAR
jgi:zinc protease